MILLGPRIIFDVLDGCTADVLDRIMEAGIELNRSSFQNRRR